MYSNGIVESLNGETRERMREVNEKCTLGQAQE